MKFVRNQDLLTNEIDGELVMLSLEQGRYYALNIIGKRIWELLKEPILIADLCCVLMAQFNVTQEQCKREVLEFLSHLQKQNLVYHCDV